MRSKMKKEIIADDRVIDSIEIELEQAKKVRDQAIKNEFDLKKEVKEKDLKISELEKQILFLTDQLNKLSGLFDEQYQIITDQILLHQVFLRNFNNNKQLVDIKIKQFNEDGKQ